MKKLTYVYKCIISILIIITVNIMMLSVAFAENNTVTISKDYTSAEEGCTTETYQPFSAKVNISIDKATVKPGESFKITLSVDNISNADQVPLNLLIWDFATSAQARALYSVVNYPSMSCDNSNVTTRCIPDDGPTKAKCMNNNDSSYHIADTEVSLEFVVKEEITDNIELEFTNAVYLNNKYAAGKITLDPIKMKIAGRDNPYTVSAKPSVESVYLGRTFTVDVVASADEETDFAAVDTVLNYDKELVKPVSAEVKNLGTENGKALYYTDGTNGVTEDGKGRLTTYGGKTALDKNGLVVATYTFEAIKTGTAQFSITDPKIGKTDQTVEMSAAVGDPASVEITEIPEDVEIIYYHKYTACPYGKCIIKYTAKAMPAEGNAYFYGDEEQPLYYAGESEDGRPVFLGFTPTVVAPDLKPITEKTGNYVTLAYDGDLNKNGNVNAIDALIAYDLAVDSDFYRKDTEFSSLGTQERFEADVNRDYVIDAKDARAIMYMALGISDPSQD